MMPMPTRRKTRKMEKVKNFCRTATAQMFLPTRRYKSDHACAISAVCLGHRSSRRWSNHVFASAAFIFAAGTF